ncbi:metal ABC transporter solute-binding protein, Zn/Mn family [Phormidesmis priestleyi]
MNLDRSFIICPWVLVSFVFAIGLVSIPKVQTQANSRKPSVVATNSVLCDLTKQIAQDTTDIKCLINPGTDPHGYQPSAGDRRAIETANLILYGGYDFEPSLIRLIQSSPSSVTKVAVYEVAVPDPIRGGQHQHDALGGELPSSGSADPHVFHSAENGIKITKVIHQALVKLNATQAPMYEKNTQKLTAQLTQIHRWIRTQIKTIPFSQRWLVTTHDAFEYYARTYNLGIASTLQGITTEEKPTAYRIAQLVQEIRAAEVPTIFAESTVNPKLIQAVAKEAKVKVADRSLYADGIGAPGTDADTYPKMLIANTKTIVQGLGGQYSPFQSQATKPSPVAQPRF